VKPRVLFVGRTRYRVPLEEAQRVKWDALAEQLDLRVLGTLARHGAPARNLARQKSGAHAMAGAPVFQLASDSRGMLGFYLSLPWWIARELRSFRPDVVVAQSPYEAAAVLTARKLTGSGARLLLEVHGDWATATRLYGSPLRRVIEPVSERVARAAVRHADAVRTVSPFTSRLVRELGVEPTAMFTTFFDVSAFLERPPTPLPAAPAALFVGVLERYKNIAGLAAAWRLTATKIPDARLRLLGRGREQPLVEALVAEFSGRVAWTPAVPPTEVAAALDESSLLVLPSFSEGLPRVAMEAFCRGRPVVGSRAGGIPDIVEDGVNGLLVPPGDARALADALVRALSDRDLLERLAQGAHESAPRWIQAPDQFAANFRELVDRIRS
jgi:glycosyltransferase involved in cell wall biosynthesis